MAPESSRSGSLGPFRASDKDWCETTGDEHSWATRVSGNASIRFCCLCNYLDLASYQQPLLPGVTACVAAHPARFKNGKLERALASVMRQTRQPDAIIVGNDTERRGAAWNRQAILDRVGTEWMAWLDSDDEWDPEHLDHLMRLAEATGAVFAFSSFHCPSGPPFDHFGIPFNPATPHHTTITFLVRTELARRVGFGTKFVTPDPAVAGWRHGGEDWLHVLGLCEIAVNDGLLMTYLAERTWTYHIDGQNSSGVAGQGDAK